MSKCYYLEGENIRPKLSSEAKALIGKKITWLSEQDIDKSGRGYFFPKYGTIVDVKGKNIAIDTPENWILYIGDIREMVIKE